MFFWLNILKAGIVAKGNPQVLATYNIMNGSKSSNKIKLIGYMHKVYHKTQGINWLKSWFYVIRWAFYGKKKYKNVRRVITNEWMLRINGQSTINWN